jgi:lactoylglutathione lyase
MVKIAQIGLWTDDVDRLASFYATYLGAEVGPVYVNPSKGFSSRFVSFGSGARLELMRAAALAPHQPIPGTQRMGFAHVALSVGSRQEVDELTARLRDDGFEVVDGPRQTGDGYYESVILDPDGNRIEIIV